MVDRRDFDVGFEGAEAALDIGEALLAMDGFGRADVGGIGNQNKFAVEELRFG